VIDAIARRGAASFLYLVFALLAACSAVPQQAKDPLASWNDGPAKAAILGFVADVTREGSPTYVPPDERIAVFDNDGTLWCEQPQYVQLAFMLDQLKAAAPQHPEWRENAAFRALAANDQKALADMGEKPVIELLAVANSGMSVDDYDRAIRDWLAKAQHPRFKRPYTDLVYQPQIELLAFLRSKGFKTYIVSGGTLEFMRPWSQKAYGVAPEQVVGSSQLVTWGSRDGRPATLVRDARFDFVNDGPGKPVGIYRAIGRRPILAFGNSDGDLQMLQYTAAGPGPRLMLLVHHDDAQREYAYDRSSQVGTLDKAWDEAGARGWTLVSMQRDWRRVFAFEP